MTRTPEQVIAHLRGRPWMQTMAGHAVPLVDTEPGDIHWIDIIQGLAYGVRYAGHAKTYSIAQHSLLVTKHMPKGMEWYGLLHDAHEAYIGDITTPAQRALVAHADIFHEGMGDVVEDGFRELKGTLDRAIFLAAGLEYPMPPEVRGVVKEVDKRVMLTEVRDLMSTPPAPWGFDLEPYPEKIVAWSPENAMYLFERAITNMLRLTLYKMSNMSTVNDLQTHAPN